MDVSTARQVLGVAGARRWSDIRAAYRSQIARAHPDRAGGDAAQAARLNVAYATLVRARRAGTLDEEARAAPDHAHERRHGPADRRAVPPEVLDGATVHVDAPPDQALRRILDACHRIGDVTYVDRSCAILEALVPVEGEGVCSLVVSLEASGGGTDAFCTLEAIERVASPPVHDVVRHLVAAL